MQAHQPSSTASSSTIGFAGATSAPTSFSSRWTSRGTGASTSRSDFSPFMRAMPTTTTCILSSIFTRVTALSSGARSHRLVASDPSADHLSKERASDEARRYFLLALASERRSLLPPSVVAVVGQIASGKTTVAERIARMSSAPAVDADRTRKHLAGSRRPDPATRSGLAKCLFTWFYRNRIQRAFSEGRVGPRLSPPRRSGRELSRGLDANGGQSTCRKPRSSLRLRRMSGRPARLAGPASRARAHDGCQ